MTSIRNFLLLLLVAQLSYGRYLEWTTSTDEQLIQESLKKSLSHLTTEQNIEVSESDAKNIVCQTHLSNGLHIKLSFDFNQRHWECELYKSSVETLGISYEKCEPVGEATPSNGDDKKPVNNEDEEADDEAAIDQLNQRSQSVGEEHDDEADLDKEQENTKTDEVNEKKETERVNNDSTTDTNDNQQNTTEVVANDDVEASTEAANNEDEDANNEQT